jgi:hypothetical protein
MVPLFTLPADGAAVLAGVFIKEDERQPGG